MGIIKNRFRQGDSVKKKLPIILLIVETVLLLLILVSGIIYFITNIEKTEVYRQSSDDGSQTVIIYEIGDPDWPFGDAHYMVYGPSNFTVTVSDNGGSGGFNVEWKENSVVIIFSGSEQKDAIYELPYD